MKDAENDAEEQSIVITDEYKQHYQNVREQMDDHPDTIEDWEKLLEELLKRNEGVENSLMSVEIRLVENLQQAQTQFQSTI